MSYAITTAMEKIHRLDKAVRVIQGGARAGKTVAIITGLIDEAMNGAPDRRITITTDDLPALKLGAMTDLRRILKEQNWGQYFRENKQDSTFTSLTTGTQIIFRPFSDEMDALGYPSDIIFVNEANRIPYGVIKQFMIRLTEYIIIDFNPVSRFWAHTEFVEPMERGERDDVDFLKLNFHDNEAIPERVRKNLEMIQPGTNDYTVFVLGEIGAQQGRVYSGWIDCELPEPVISDDPNKRREGAKLIGVGGDWGFAGDPTAVVGVYMDDDKNIYLDEWFYSPGVYDDQVARELLRDHPEMRDVIVVMDSANPQGIAQWRQIIGGNVFSAKKGAGSIIDGVNMVRQLKIHITPRSKNLRQEYENYQFKKNKLDGFFPVPVDANNHLADAARYILVALRNTGAI